MRFIADALLLVAMLAPLVALALWTTRNSEPRWAVLFLALLLFDTLITPLEYILGVHPPGLQWNWTGKVLSIAWALAFVRWGPLTTREVGLTLRQRPGSMVPAVLLTAAVIVIPVLLGAGGQRAGAETLLYQATMPGLAEELAMRGVFLALLYRAFGGAPRPEPASGRAPDGWDARLWPILITSLAFGLWHGVAIRNGQVTLDAIAFLLPFAGGVAFAWLRVRTGSLLFPILAHNGANLVAYLVPG
ncbi:MAG TPA: CPBP family intramembrane glutamic endopeptidase [Longimicrobium sp.]|nr:CPBP family intramembrane glutamic endopeptidase [Longimicrobium sp.]